MNSRSPCLPYSTPLRPEEMGSPKSPAHSLTRSLLVDMERILGYMKDSSSVVNTISTLPQNNMEAFWDGIESALAGLREAYDALS